MTESIRRSGRVKKRNPKYASNSVGELDLEEIAISSSSSDASSFNDKDVEDEEDVDVEEESASDDDDNSAAEIEEDHVSREGSNGVEEVLIELPDNTVTKGIAIHKSTKKPKKQRNVDLQPDGLRSRGCHFNRKVRNKHITIHELAGDDDYFLGKMESEMDKYLETLTVPFRESNGVGRFGLAYPEVYSDMVREAEKQDFLMWYEENKAWKKMAEAQSTSNCELHERELYVNTELPPQCLLLGPYDTQHPFTLGLGNSISLSQAWQTAISATQNGDDYDESACNRPAWIVNLGSRVLSMDWAPNQTGSHQFLAVSVAKTQPPNIPEVSSFEPVEPHEASVQIWAFSTVLKGNTTVMDMDTKPKLVHVMCLNWGMIRRLSWCPAAVSIAENSKSIGLLATISTDGFIRVVDVSVDMEIDNPYVKYEAAAFASKPPDTVCTCLTWLSASQIAAGCANGHVAIWDVGKHIAAKSSHNAIPNWYHALHTTFIISVMAHQPYPCQYITTNAVEGRIRVTSIRNPYADTVYGSRERHLTSPPCTSPHILGFYEIDETDGIRTRSIRHIPMSRAIGKAPAQVICTDAGKAHPCLMIGCADGSVVITCPLRRVFIRRFVREKMAAWQQTWFRHEFVPDTRLEAVDYNTSLQRDSERQSHIYPRRGISRFLESFKTERVSMARGLQQIKERNAGEVDDEEDLPAPETLPTEKQEQNSASLEEVQISIYEEEQAVTCLSWNTNIYTGGWAAAGMANGLLRIEDVAI